MYEEGNPIYVMYVGADAERAANTPGCNLGLIGKIEKIKRSSERERISARGLMLERGPYGVIVSKNEPDSGIVKAEIVFDFDKKIQEWENDGRMRVLNMPNRSYRQCRCFEKASRLIDYLKTKRIPYDPNNFVLQLFNTFSEIAAN